MIAVYPAVFTKHENEIVVYFPDLGINTGGDDLAEALAMASDALGVCLAYLQDEGKPIPPPSDIESITPDNAFVSYVMTDVSKYHDDSKAVNKMVTMPKWMLKLAAKNDLNCSKLLQDAICEKLGIW